jgi:carbon-monoxide dehydrogenase medium subunit
MYPSSFDYYLAADPDDAIAKLKLEGDDAKVLAGGQSLIPLMKLRFAAPATIVDIGRLSELCGVDSADRHAITIGALTTESELEWSTVIRDRVPILAEASATIADPLVRNQATVGGNLAHADPANDLPAVMLALDAEFVVRGSEGERILPVDEFFVQFFTTALANDEILTHIRIPTPNVDAGSAYVKNKRQVGDFPVAAAAVVMSVDDGQIAHARVGITNAGATAVRSTSVERYLAGRGVAEIDAADAAARVLDDVSPAASVRGSERYRRAMFVNVVEDAIVRALARTEGGME